LDNNLNEYLLNFENEKKKKIFFLMTILYTVYIFFNHYFSLVYLFIYFTSDQIKSINLVAFLILI